VHACLVVDNEPLAVPASALSWTRLSPTPVAPRGQSDAVWWCELHYTRAFAIGSLTHRRQVILARDAGVVVCDWVTGDVRSGCALHWPLGADADELRLEGAALTAGRHRVRWATTNERLPMVTLEPLTRSPGYGRAHPGRLLRVGLEATRPQTIVTTFTTATTTSDVSFAEHDRVRVTLGNARASAELTIGPGIAPVLGAAAAVRARAEGVLR
jgi:hypothetical protein